MFVVNSINQICRLPSNPPNTTFDNSSGGRRTLEELYPADLEKFAKDIEVRAPFVRRRMAEIAEAIVEQCDGVLYELDLSADRQKVVYSITDDIIERTQLILSRLKS